MVRLIQVLATREGLVGKTTSSGYIIETHVPFVALPAAKALFKVVRVTNPATTQSCEALVLDVGPHSDNDDAYVFGGARPLAEQGISIVNGIHYHAANRAGIDLGEKVWHLLGMTDNTNVEWEFIL